MKLTSAHESLSAEETRTEAIEILRGLVEAINIRPPAKTCTEVEFVGDIVKILEFPTNECSGFERRKDSVKVVAGPGYQRYLHSGKEWIRRALQVRFVGPKPPRIESEGGGIKVTHISELASCTGNPPLAMMAALRRAELIIHHTGLFRSTSHGEPARCMSRIPPPCLFGWRRAE